MADRRARVGSGCSREHPLPVPGPRRSRNRGPHVGLPAAALGLALLWLLPACAAWGKLPSIEAAWIERVYPSAHAAHVWFTAEGPRPAVDAALRELRAAADRGLAASDYDIGALEVLVRAASGRAAPPDAVARADRALTAAILQFLSDLRIGRVRPQQVEQHFRAPAKDAPFVAALREAVASNRLGDMIAASEPAFPQYVRLKRLLTEYRSLAMQPAPALSPLPASRSKIVVGDRYAGVPELRKLLERLGDLAPDPASAVDDRYSESVAEGVRRFQARHGLEADGALGKATFAALGVPIATRVDQIVLSLERLRWLPEPAPGPLIAINIPSFRLWALDDAARPDRPVLSMPVIAGRAMRSETPVFLGLMRYVEFSPYWNVPPSILRNEILPRLATDPAYLDREDMELVSLRGGRPMAASDAGAAVAALAAGEARLRQRPGPGNALGGVKFVLPNTMNIYLHATPARRLFDRERRDFSHGCIRVGEPEALASFVLRGRPDWDSAAIRAAMTSGVNRTVSLETPIPVVVFYTTAIADAEGRALFLADVYGHDRKLLAALRAAGRSVD